MTTAPTASRRLLAASLGFATAMLASCAHHTPAAAGTAPAAVAETSSSLAAAVTVTDQRARPIGEPVQPAGNTTATPAAGLIPARSVNTADPAAVAVAAVTTMNRSDTLIDRSPFDAVRRAGRWFTPTLLADSLHVPERGNAAWTTLSRHHGYTVVDHVELANETGQPANTPTSAYIQISYQVREVGRDGWRSTSTTRLSRVQLRRIGPGPWLVNGFSA